MAIPPCGHLASTRWGRAGIPSSSGRSPRRTYREIGLRAGEQQRRRARRRWPGALSGTSAGTRPARLSLDHEQALIGRLEQLAGALAVTWVHRGARACPERVDAGHHPGDGRLHATDEALHTRLVGLGREHAELVA